MSDLSSMTVPPIFSLDTSAKYYSLCSSHVAPLKSGRTTLPTLNLLLQIPCIVSLSGAAFLLLFIASTILSTSAQALPSHRGAALSAGLANIRLSELLSNPQTDWDNDGDTGSANQWIELANTSTSSVDISHLELLSHGSNNNQPVLLSRNAQIGPSGFFVIFVDQTITSGGTGGFHLFPGGQQLDMIDGDTGAVLDSINYPALGSDLSFSRHPGASGGWDITGTPTPNAPNDFTIPGSPTPTPTHTPKPSPTPRNGKGGGDGSGGNATPTTTPFPASSVVVPSGSALASQQDDSATDSAGGTAASSTFPSWLKIALLAVLGAGLLVVIIWYIRSWSQEPESGG